MKKVNYNYYQNFILVFLWLSGFLNGFVNFIGLGLDLVIISLAMVIFDIFFNLASRKIIYYKYSINLLVVILFFFAWIAFSTVFSSSTDYKYIKAGNFLINIIYFIYPFFIRKFNFNFIINLYIIILVPLSLFLIYMKSITYSVPRESIELFIGYWFDYLSLGFHLGVLALLLNYFNKNLYLQILIIGLLFASSARAPFIFTIILLILINFNFKNLIKNNFFLKSKKTFLFLILLISTQLNRILPLFENAIQRFLSLTGGDDYSSADRMVMMKYAFNQPFEKISTFIFGNGIGSFGLNYIGEDERNYPHNIFLEIFFELGLIGLIIFFVLILLILKRFSLKNNIFSILLFFAFLNALKSSNLTDLWIFFSFIGGMSLINKKIKLNDNNNRL